MSDEMIIRCCAPTLAAIETGSLFNCPVGLSFVEEYAGGDLQVVYDRESGFDRFARLSATGCLPHVGKAYRLTDEGSIPPLSGKTLLRETRRALRRAGEIRILPGRAARIGLQTMGNCAKIAKNRDNRNSGGKHAPRRRSAAGAQPTAPVMA